MKNKEDASKAKSDEFLAFEVLAKCLINSNKEDSKRKAVSSKDKSNRKPKELPSKR